MSAVENPIESNPYKPQRDVWYQAILTEANEKIKIWAIRADEELRDKSFRNKEWFEWTVDSTPKNLPLFNYLNQNINKEIEFRFRTRRSSQQSNTVSLELKIKQSGETQEIYFDTYNFSGDLT